MDAQTMKARGPNPNPTAQARSKRCLPLSTKPQNIIESAPLRTPIFNDFWYLFQAFSTKVFEGVQGHAQQQENNNQMTSEGTEMKPPGSQNGAQMSTKANNTTCLGKMCHMRLEQ